MPQDLAIMAAIEKALLSDETKKLLAGTQYVFSSYGNDIQFDSSGKLMLYENKEKLVQSTLKILLTAQGDAAEDVNYGSALLTYLGGKLTNDSYTELVDSVQKAVSYYNDLNSDNLSSTEYVDTINQVGISTSTQDPRIVIFKLQMTNEAGETVNITIPLAQ